MSTRNPVLFSERPTSNIVVLTGDLCLIDGVLHTYSGNVWYPVAILGVDGKLSTDIVGNVTGNLTGNVTGNVTGAVTGNASTATLAATATLARSIDGGAPVNAVASVLSTNLAGENNDLTFTARVEGESGDEISVAYINPGTPSAALGIVVTEDAITVNLATDAGTKSDADIGGGADGTVTTVVDAPGPDGDDYTIEVVVGAGNDIAMSAAIVGTAITVTLGTGGAGAVDNAKNTATLVAAAISLLSGVTATASGTGATALTTAEGPTSFTGGVAPAITSTANAIIAAIEADEDANDLVTVAAKGEETGAGVVIAMVATSLAGGVDGTVGLEGELLFDTAELYICIAPNDVSGANWRKVSLGTVY